LVGELDRDLEELKISGAATGARGELVGEASLLEQGEKGSLGLVTDEVREIVRGLLEIVLISRREWEDNAEVAQVLHRHDLEHLALCEVDMMLAVARKLGDNAHKSNVQAPADGRE
jgi:hypothetical protein